MKHIEYLYRTLASKTDARFIDYQDETLYLYPKFKKKFLIGIAFTFISLIGASVFFLFQAKSFSLSDKSSFIGFVCLGVSIMISIPLLMVYRSRNHWLVKIDDKEIEFYFWWYKDSISWNNVSEIWIKTIKTRYSQQSFVSMKPLVEPAHRTIRKKMERLFGFGGFNIGDDYLPLSIRDLYDALVVYWHDTK